jgi:TRAP-type C4-dicarboxylate transport system permease small subunit
MKIIQKLSDILGKILEVLIVFLLVLMTALMFAQVLGRFIFKNGLFWAEELSRFTMVTMVYLGAGLACKYKDHISVTILDEFLKGPLHKIYRLFLSLLSIVFLFVIAYYGFKVLAVVSTQKSANMQITMNWIYMMMPIGAVIMIFYVLVEILEVFFMKKDDATGEITSTAGGNKA